MKIFETIVSNQMTIVNRKPKPATEPEQRQAQPSSFEQLLEWNRRAGYLKYTEASDVC